MKKALIKIISIISMFLILASCGKSAENTEVIDTAALSQTVMELALGTTGELSVADYTGTVEWSSSDTNVATVNENGIVTPVSIGGVAITATLENGKTMTCVVDIKAGTSNVQSISVTSIYSDANDITVNYNKDQKINLKAVCTPAEPGEVLNWSSSDELLARVDQNGVVTVYGNGMVEIKATALNGVEGKCLVRIKNVPATVQPPQPSVSSTNVPEVTSSDDISQFTSSVPVASASAKSSVIISEKRVYLSVGEAAKLTYAVSNSDDMTVQWVSTDKAVAIVKDGCIVAIGEGRATISAVTSDGAVASCSVAVGKDAIRELKDEDVHD